MARTAPPATPGTDPNAVTATSDAPEAAVPETPEQKVARLEREMADMRAMMQTLGRNQLAQSMPEKVSLPELAAIMKQKPDIPVLTQAGWYVPPVLPQQRAG